MTMASFSSISLLNEFEKKKLCNKTHPPLIFRYDGDSSNCPFPPRFVFPLSYLCFVYPFWGHLCLAFPRIFFYVQQQNKCTYVLLQFVENMLPKTPCFPSFSLLLPIHMIFFCCKKGKAYSSPDFILSSERTEMRMQSIHITINNT